MKVDIKKGDIAVGNVFTFGFLEDPNVTIKSSQISWEEFDEVLKNEEFVNYMGHEDVAHMVGLKMNRISISVHQGAKIFLAQYEGPRLPEGCTTLPKGAKLIPLKIEVL